MIFKMYTTYVNRILMNHISCSDHYCFQLDSLHSKRAY